MRCTKGVIGLLCLSIASTISAIDVEWNIQQILTNTSVPLGPVVTIEPGEIGLLEVKFIAKNGVSSVLLETKTYPNTAPRGPYRVTTTFDIDIESTHWEDGTEITFEIQVKYLDTLKQEQDADPITTTRQVYNKSSVISDVYSPSIASIVAINYRDMNYEPASYRQNNDWLRDDYKKSLWEPWGEGPTIHFVSSHGDCVLGFGEITAPGNVNDPVREKATILPLPGDPGKDISLSVKVSKDAGCPPLQFALIGSCKIGSDSVFCNAYISQQALPSNVAVIAFIYSISDIDLSLFTGEFLELCEAGWPVKEAVDKAGQHTWGADWPGYAENTKVKIFGDQAKTLKYLYDGSGGQKTTWFKVNEESSGGPGGPGL